jgi:Zn/Cd-binding protein ZinT
MAIEFYDVKLREKVSIPESEVRKTTYEREGKEGKVNVRFAFRAENEGTKLTKFVSQSDWAALEAPLE